MTEPSAAQGSPFWTFSLHLYAKPGVADACLALQDGQGVDVNLLLFALWTGQNGRLLRLSEMRGLIGLTEVWRREVVAPLRHVRRVLREPPQAIDAVAVARLRQEIKKLELESERLQQAALFDWRPLEGLGSVDMTGGAAAANVALYAEALSIAFDAVSVATILAALDDLFDQP
ncbi:MAG TPA: TIGR02444 family protein [Beijerinckiaceae bacterium]|nr:TIGR02444 family protein [Beijerinckiaceae bacterium]